MSRAKVLQRKLTISNPSPAPALSSAEFDESSAPSTSSNQKRQSEADTDQGKIKKSKSEEPDAADVAESSSSGWLAWFQLPSISRAPPDTPPQRIASTSKDPTESKQIDRARLGVSSLPHASHPDTQSSGPSTDPPVRSQELRNRLSSITLRNQLAQERRAMSLQSKGKGRDRQMYQMSPLLGNAETVSLPSRAVSPELVSTPRHKSMSISSADFFFSGATKALYNAIPSIPPLPPLFKPASAQSTPNLLNGELAPVIGQLQPSSVGSSDSFTPNPAPPYVANSPVIAPSPSLSENAGNDTSWTGSLSRKFWPAAATATTQMKVKSTTPESKEPQVSEAIAPVVPSTNEIPKLQNMVLPSFEDVFFHKSRKPPVENRKSIFQTLMPASNSSVPSSIYHHLPQASRDVTGRRPKCIACIGVHGYFPSNIIKTFLGEPTGTSALFAKLMAQSVASYLGQDSECEIVQIPLEGEGKVKDRLELLYAQLVKNKAWLEILLKADAVFVVAHSQGVIVSTGLIRRLMEQKQVGNNNQKICLLGLCGVHNGPLPYLNQSAMTSSYLNYFESPAAHELFEFQSTQSQASTSYNESLAAILNAGVKVLYIASLADQLVPIYSAIHNQAHHPNIFRALYIEGDSYDKQDFLTCLLVFALSLRNAGLDDFDVCVHLSEAVAGALTGVGHSTAYNESAVYNLAIKFLLETTTARAPYPPNLLSGDLDTRTASNPYDLPWLLKSVVESRDIQDSFGEELAVLRQMFESWDPKVKNSKDLKQRLEPLRLVNRGRVKFGSSQS